MPTSSGFDIDVTVEGSLESTCASRTGSDAPRPRPGDSDRARAAASRWTSGRSIPDPTEIGFPGREPIRVTTDRGRLRVLVGQLPVVLAGWRRVPCVRARGRPRTGSGSAGRGIAWLVERSNGSGSAFVISTRFGVRQVGCFEELATALDVVDNRVSFRLGTGPTYAFQS